MLKCCIDLQIFCQTYNLAHGCILLFLDFDWARKVASLNRSKLVFRSFWWSYCRIWLCLYQITHLNSKFWPGRACTRTQRSQSFLWIPEAKFYQQEAHSTMEVHWIVHFEAHCLYFSVFKVVFGQIKEAEDSVSGDRMKSWVCQVGYLLKMLLSTVFLTLLTEVNRWGSQGVCKRRQGALILLKLVKRNSYTLKL